MSTREIDLLREVPLADVLRRLGATRDARDKARWNTDRGAVSVRGMRFFAWRAHKGGGGAIDLVMHLRGVGFKGALAWLREAFGDAHVTRHAMRHVAMPDPCEHIFRPPERDDAKLERVVRYLQTERGIPRHFLAPFIDAKTVYADMRANAVFLHRDPRGASVGAELRGTTRMQWRGMARASRKAAGYFAAGSAKARELILCESAIDAISLHVMRPTARCISTAGACPDRPWIAPLLATGARVLCGFDADNAGDTFARAMIARYPAITRLRPAAHDWNEALAFHCRAVACVHP